MSAFHSGSNHRRCILFYFERMAAPVAFHISHGRRRDNDDLPLPWRLFHTLTSQRVETQRARIKRLAFSLFYDYRMLDLYFHIWTNRNWLVRYSVFFTHRSQMPLPSRRVIGVGFAFGSSLTMLLMPSHSAPPNCMTSQSKKWLSLRSLFHTKRDFPHLSTSSTLPSAVSCLA